METSLTQLPQYLTSSLSANLTPSYPSPHCHPCPSLTISWLHHCVTSNPLSSSNLAPTCHSLQSSQSSLLETWIWSCHPLLKTLQWLPIIFRRLHITLNRPTRPPYVFRSACSSSLISCQVSMWSTGRRWKAQTLEQLCHPLPVWHWASCPISLCFHSFVSKSKMIVVHQAVEGWSPENRLEHGKPLYMFMVLGSLMSCTLKFEETRWVQKKIKEGE